MNIRCPHCHTVVELVGSMTFDRQMVCESCKSPMETDDVLSIADGDTLTVTLDSKYDIGPGSKLAQFELVELLGRGGFGSVYVAKDTQLDRMVAIKIPRMEKLSQWSANAFIREAQAAAQLDDPNIVSVYEIGHDNGQAYIVSQLIDGVTLSQWQRDVQPDQKTAAILIAKTARSIHKAHEKKVIHRDLKPANILVANGEPHITDFGLAKRETPEDGTITTRGHIIGTPAYMSPEQATGKADLADGRTDVFSLGVILYELLAGKRPFRGESDIVLNEVVDLAPHPIKQSNSKVSSDLEAICLKAMAKKPGDRFLTALEFAEDLERFIDDRPTLTRPPTSVERGVRFFSRRKAQIAMAGLVLGLLAALIYASLGPRVPSNLKRVTFEVNPKGAEVTIAKVDYELGRVDLGNILVPESAGSGTNFSIDLEPGFYVVECYKRGHGIQEVFRTVPGEVRSKAPSELRNMRWEETSEQDVVWPNITIIAHNITNDEFFAGPEELVKRPGGRFDASGPSDSRFRQGRVVDVAPFYIGKYEVTEGGFNTIMKRLPKGAKFDATQQSEVLVNVDFHEALEYCERIGCRLPLFDEYLFAATNGGKTKFPMGDVYPEIDAWPISTLGKPDFDVTIDQPPVFNLYSSAIEWTQQYEPPLDDAGLPIEDIIFPNLSKSFLLGGGPSSIVFGEFEDEPVFDPRDVSQMAPSLIENRPGLGFRVAYSSEKRIVANRPQENGAD